MKLTQSLDSILNTEAKTKILRFLCKTGAQWNGTQIAKEIKLTPAAVHNALRDLYGEGLLHLRNMGKTHIYSLEEDNFIVSDLIKPLFDKEDRILDEIIGIMRRGILSFKPRKDIISAALFGSVIERGEYPESDIDLLIIAKNRMTVRSLEALIDEIDAKISKKFGKTISPYVNTIAEFKEKYSKNTAVIKNILKSHNLIYGIRLEKLI